MNRRRLLKLAGLVTAGGSISLGTGAFTSSSATRTVEVSVADDDEAYLALEDTSEKARSYSYNNPDQIAFEIPGNHEDTLGDGVGQNSIYEFSNLVDVRNRGDDPVVVWSESVSNSSLKAVHLTHPEKVLESKSKGVLLAPGESFSAGLLVKTGDYVGDFVTEIIVRAEVTGRNGQPGPDG